MTNSDSDGLFDNDWEDRGELSWTEAEWVKYLNAQEEAVQEYLKHYEQLTLVTDRIDEVARRMIDFSSGLCYALHGKIEKVARGVYLLKPDTRPANPEY